MWAVGWCLATRNREGKESEGRLVLGGFLGLLWLFFFGPVLLDFSFALHGLVRLEIFFFFFFFFFLAVVMSNE